ncbi:MAG: hypothetical protein KF746_19970 [Chitinophagaceae bacterium]|nr:hypothetical protein [Chitinophagaceae bacterium]
MKLTKGYAQWLKQLKIRVRSAQIKVALKVNAELLSLYWDIGAEVLEKEKNAGWGTGLLPKLSQDLQKTFPDVKGFSLTNIKYIRLWVSFYEFSIRQQAVDELRGHPKKKSIRTKGQQPVDPIPSILTTIPWGHHLQIITKCKDVKEALFTLDKPHSITGAEACWCTRWKADCIGGKVKRLQTLNILYLKYKAIWLTSY